MTTMATNARRVEQRADQLKITEIFYSLQGEARDMGRPTVFVRLTGCPLRCDYCDTAYAFTGGEWRSINDILQQVTSYPAQHVCVTGGEPLAQKRCHALLAKLCDVGYEVSLETSGALSVAAVDPRVVKVLDLKTPASGECARNRWDNLDDLGARDQIKFVVCDRGDFDWALARVRAHRLDERFEVWLSPSHEQLEAAKLAGWILESGARVRMQIQMHKYIWGDVAGR